MLDCLANVGPKETVVYAEDMYGKLTEAAMAGDVCLSV